MVQPLLLRVPRSSRRYLPAEVVVRSSSLGVEAGVAVVGPRELNGKAVSPAGEIGLTHLVSAHSVANSRNVNMSKSSQACGTTVDLSGFEANR